MTVKELREAIASLPDTACVQIEIRHTDFDWLDTSTRYVDVEYFDPDDCLLISATVKDPE